MIGKHSLKFWSVTQHVIALSSGEGEYYGMVKGASNAIGVSGMLRNMFTDSSAAKGISSRRGLGKVRRIEVNELWLQDQVARGKV